MTATTKLYPHITGLRGDEGENAATLAVVAVLDPSPHYPDCARIIVGSPETSEAVIGGFSGGPAEIRQLAATLNQAAADVDAATGGPSRDAVLAEARELAAFVRPFAWSPEHMSPEHYEAAAAAMEIVPELVAEVDRLRVVAGAARAYLTAPPASSDEDGWHDPPFEAYATLCAAMKAYDGTEPRDVEAAPARRLTHAGAVEIARRCAKAKPRSYFAEPFEPHDWVLDAILEAANGGTNA